jgi:hypothetical protein
MSIVRPDVSWYTSKDKQIKELINYIITFSKLSVKQYQEGITLRHSYVDARSIEYLSLIHGSTELDSA